MDIDTLQSHIDAEEARLAAQPWYIKFPRIIGERVYYRFILQIPDWAREIKWGFQRFFRGYSERDLWGLNDFVIEKIRAPFKAFVKYEVEMGHGVPIDFTERPEEWVEILKKIEFSFDNFWEEDFDWDNWYGKKKGWTSEQHEEYNKKVQEGFELFGKYLQNLWD